MDQEKRNPKTGEIDFSSLSKSGQKALKLLTQGRERKKLHYPGQVVTYIDPPEFKINGDVCVVILNDYFAPETCDGDYNKLKFDGCEFPIPMLYEALSQVQPGGKAYSFGKAVFCSKLHEWGSDYEDYNQSTAEEDAITLELKLSSLCNKVTLTVVRQKYNYYAKIERKASLLEINRKNEKIQPITKSSFDKAPRRKGIPNFIPQDEEVNFVKVTKEPSEMSFALDFLGKSNSYYRDQTFVLQIRDHNGHKIKPVWQAEWKAISPGIRTRKGVKASTNGSQENMDAGCIQIDRFACPVSIQFRQNHEYIDYDGDYSSSYSSDYWVVYESEVGSDG